LNDVFGMWRRRSALCLYGIGVLEPEKEEHPTTPQIVEVHQRPVLGYAAARTVGRTPDTTAVATPAVRKRQLRTPRLGYVRARANSLGCRG